MAYVSSPRSRVRATLALALTLLAYQGGCGSTVDEEIALATLSQDCLVNSDCSSPLVCAFEACHAECVSSRDCEAGARCVAAARPYKVCQLEEERACARTADCAEGLVCGVDGECRDQCLTENDCVESQLCVSGTCADREELDEDMQLEPAPGVMSGSEGAPCVYVSDCSGALLCRSQACLAQCKADKDCEAGRVCEETRCVLDGSAPAACTFSSECETERGERCLSGGCRCACAENRDCPSGELCNGCGCEPDPEAPAPCVYNSDCEEEGQVCRDRACACECKVDLDCADGSTCDGCGCVALGGPIDGVVMGDLFVESSLQLALYRGVQEIQGSLYISGAYVADLGDTFDQLARVTGNIQVSSNALLERIRFPKLTDASTVSFSNLSSLEQLALPRLRHGDVGLSELPLLIQASFPALEKSSLYMHRLLALSALSVPLLREATNFTLDQVPLVTKLELPSLVKVSNELIVTSGSTMALAVLSAPQLASLGPPAGGSNRLFIEATSLTSLSELGAPGWSVNTNVTSVSNNPQLSVCAANAFIERLQTGGLVSGVSIVGNQPCSTCQGAVCAD
jgi:hypothetical protein